MNAYKLPFMNIDIYFVSDSLLIGERSQDAWEPSEMITSKNKKTTYISRKNKMKHNNLHHIYHYVEM